MPGWGTDTAEAKSKQEVSRKKAHDFVAAEITEAAENCKKIGTRN